MLRADAFDAALFRAKESVISGRMYVCQWPDSDWAFVYEPDPKRDAWHIFEVRHTGEITRIGGYGPNAIVMIKQDGVVGALMEVKKIKDLPVNHTFLYPVTTDLTKTHCYRVLSRLGKPFIEEGTTGDNTVCLETVSGHAVYRFGMNDECMTV